MNDERSLNPSPIILGRPFLNIARTKINISKGILTMKFDREVAHFNIFNEMKYPINSQFVFAIHAINPSV